MDFAWTPEQYALSQKIEHAISTQLIPVPPVFRSAWRVCGEIGLLGLSIPHEYGGLGLNALSSACALETFGRTCSDMGLVFAVSAHLLACAMPLATYGCPTLKTQVLPHLCSGEWIAANAITEQEAGSDVFAMKTQARPGDANYLLNGRKSFVTNGPLADLFVIYAVTQPRHGYLGISTFAVKRETPGLTASPPFQKMGLATAQAGTLDLEDCQVSADALLGRPGQGAEIFQYSMQWERTCLFAAYLGMLDRQLQQTIDHARTRRQFGRSLAQNQAVSHRIVEMKLRLESARWLIYRACWLLDQGASATLEISLAKLAVSQAAIASSLDALHLHGATGYTAEAGLETMLRDSISTAIFSGSTEIQRDLIARELGL